MQAGRQGGREGGAMQSQPLPSTGRPTEDPTHITYGCSRPAVLPEGPCRMHRRPARR